MDLTFMHYDPSTRSSSRHGGTRQPVLSPKPLPGVQGRDNSDEVPSTDLPYGDKETEFTEKECTVAHPHKHGSFPEYPKKPTTGHGDDHSSNGLDPSISSQSGREPGTTERTTLAGPLPSEGVLVPAVEVTHSPGLPALSASVTSTHHGLPASHAPCTSHTEGTGETAMDTDDDGGMTLTAEASLGQNDRADATDLQADDSIMDAATDEEQVQHTAVTHDGVWEIDAILGKEVLSGKVHYLVKWKPTLVSVDEMDALALIKAFEAAFGVRTRQPAKGARVAKVTSESRKLGKANARGRGRPRKQRVE